MEQKIKELHEIIQNLKAQAEELSKLGGDVPCVIRNSKRVLATIKMLELEISDIVGL
jgi:hypothetical protein